MTTNQGLVTGFLLGSLVTVIAMMLTSKRNKEKKGLRDESMVRSRSVMSHNTTGFLTDLIQHMWSHISIAGAKAIIEAVEPSFKDLPSPLSTLRFTKVELGSRPLVLDNIVVHPVTNNKDAVQVDMDIIWITDCHIQLKADYIGSFGVKSLELSGRLSFLCNLTDQLPVISAIQYGFVNTPELDLDFTGLANVADFSFLSNSIRNVMLDTITSMLVLPNRMFYWMDTGCSLMDIYQPPVGIARVTLCEGQGFQIEKRRFAADDIPDVYCNVSLGNKTWKTSTIPNCLEPCWNETCDFVLSNHDQVLNIHAWDEDKGTLDPDDDLGCSELTVGEMLLAGKSVTVELQEDHKGTGAFVTLNCQLCQLSEDVSELQNLMVAEGDSENKLVGLLTVVVTRAFDIPLQKKEAATFVKVTCGKRDFVTGTVVDYPGVDALNPLYDCCFQIPMTAIMVREALAVEFQLLNKTISLGSTQLSLQSLLKESTITEKRSIGDKGASLEFRVMLRAAKEPIKQSSRALFAPPSIDDEDSGFPTVRITAVKGVGFKKQRRRLRKADIPDIYLKVKFGSSPNVWRTSTIKDSITPNWNESRDFVLKDNAQIISVDVWDEDKRGFDDWIGNARVAVGQVLLAGGTMDIELQKDGAKLGIFVTLDCEIVP